MINSDNIYKCAICDREFKSIISLTNHITHNHCSVQTYYDKYLKKENEGICIDCGAPTKFKNIIIGYKMRCKKCSFLNRNKRIGNIVKNKSKEEKELILQKRITTTLNKYGVKNVSQLDASKAKQQQTNLKRYGVQCSAQSNAAKEKAKQTNFKKYGVENPMQCDKIKEKQKQTCIEHFGVDNPSKINEIKERIKQTNLDKYGVEYYFRSGLYLDKLDEIQQKMYNTKKKNHTFNSSKIEDLFEGYLKHNNYQYVRQYKSMDYPYDCDFYLPNYKLYVEINAHWTHGHHPYNSVNENDIQTLNKWKSRNTKYYDNAIETWTGRDVNKLKTAKENNLNYLPIYSNDMNEVINQFENYIKIKSR